MLCRSLAGAIVASLGMMSAAAAPLGSGELATLRETKVVFNTPTPTDAALELARKVGRERNLDGLRDIIRLQQPLLVERAVDSLDLLAVQDLPEPVEALIVEFYRDPVAHRPLLGLVGRGMRQDGSSFPQYRGRALFGLLLADMKAKPNEASMYARRLVSTELKGVEPDLVAALPGLERAAANELVGFIGRRRYAPAVSALRAVQETTPFARSVNGLLGNVNAALVEIGTPEAVQAVLDRMKWLSSQSGPAAMSEIAGLFYTLKRMPATTRPDYAMLRPVLPKELSPEALSALVGFVVARKDRRGLPDLIAAAARGNGEALTAVLAWGTPEDWRVTQAQLDQAVTSGTVQAARARPMQGLLHAAIANPAQQAAATLETERKKAFADARARLDQERAASAALRDADPKRYATAVDETLQRAEQLIAANPGRQEATWYRRDVGAELQRLASYVRFTLGDPARAVQLYERAIAIADGLPASEDPGLMARIGLADTVRFDLQDARRSLRIYQDLRERGAKQPRSTNDDVAGFQRALDAWLSAEIRFLEKGERYAGTPDAVALGMVGMVMFSGGGATAADDLKVAAMLKTLHERAADADEKRQFARQLEALSPSQVRLISALDVLPLLGSAERVAAFLRKHDPAGYLTASGFAVWHYFERETAAKAPPAMPGMHIVSWSENERSLMRQAELAVFGRSVGLDTKVDPRLATPESTWKAFLEALRRGDLEAAWACTTPGIRNKFEPSFATMTPKQLQTMADAMVGFQRTGAFGEFVEAVVARSNGHAGVVTFVRQGKEWRIVEM